jgi:F-type H+-transporting ATPase subunit epsilon
MSDASAGSSSASGVTGTGKSLDVHVVTPDEERWAGPARFLVARAAGGDVGVLPGHEPMLSVMGEGTVRIEREGGASDEVRVTGGFLSVGVTSEGVTRVDILAEHVE